MVREPLEGSLRNGVERAALLATAFAVTLIGLGLVGELLRRRRRAPTLVATLDRFLPGAARVAAVALIATLPLLVGVRMARADSSVRGWLRGATESTAPTALTPPTTSTTAPTTSTTTPSVATNATIDRTPAAVVLPPLPAPSTPTPAPAPTAEPAVPPSASGSAEPSAEQYVVQAGDCLWSIAQRHLPAGASNRAIDAGWRQIYSANAAAIGQDPNLIHVGLELVLPPITDMP